jgi:hypothetical protein
MSVETRSDLVEFGPGEPVAENRLPRWRMIAGDPRTAVALTVLGGAAAVASLLGQWQTISMPGFSDSPDSVREERMINNIWTIGAVGYVYLFALLSLAALTALAMFGQPAGRFQARVAGLGVSAATLVVLGAAGKVMSTADITRQFFGMPESMAEKLTITLERGLGMAIAAIALLGLALLSAHLRPAATVDDAETAAGKTGGPGTRGSGTPGSDTRSGSGPGPGEIELTVSSAAPFMRQY